MFENIKNKRNPLGVELVNAGVITEDALDQALKYQKEHPDLKIGEIVDILNLCPKERTSSNFLSLISIIYLIII